MANPVETTETKSSLPTLREVITFTFYCYGGMALLMSLLLSFCPTSLDTSTEAFRAGVTGFLALITANSFRPKT